MNRRARLQKATLTLWFALLTAQSPAQSFEVVHHFTNRLNGFFPTGDLVKDGETLYGTTRIAIFKVNTDGSGYGVLKHLTNTADSFDLSAGLVLNGTTLYGTAYQGGTNNNGTVFKIDTDGNDYTLLKAFTGGSDGRQPRAGLVLSGDTLYGTTTGGGSNGFGTVFKVGIDGSNFSVLKHFLGNPDGFSPNGRLVLNGNMLYGTTTLGGSNQSAGIIYKLNTDGGDYAILKHFASDALDGEAPYGGMVLSGSALYGTTSGGGSNGVGTVYKINTDGTGFAVLKHFVPGADQSRPASNLILIGATLLGTTSIIGAPGNGMVFKVNTDGSGFAAVHQFSAFVDTYHTNSDGACPQAGLVAENNTLYGTASYGGNSYYEPAPGSYFGLGTIFKITLPPPLQILTHDASFGIQSNAFGFNVTGDAGQVIVVDACADLTAPDWMPLRTNTLGATPTYFNDPDWSNHSARFYRVRIQ